ncbi:hypothetical protein ACJMK2_011227 [Sinanodonta woodiana]|uniref:Uncharacterized protein n=1 Tax=Sinanodonta woodiana TaxID=1069815 RepID=A0ABD3V6T7_SINWO
MKFKYFEYPDENFNEINTMEFRYFEYPDENLNETAFMYFENPDENLNETAFKYFEYLDENFYEINTNCIREFNTPNEVVFYFLTKVFLMWVAFCNLEVPFSVYVLCK